MRSFTEQRGIQISALYFGDMPAVTGEMASANVPGVTFITGGQNIVVGNNGILRTENNLPYNYTPSQRDRERIMPMPSFTPRDRGSMEREAFGMASPTFPIVRVQNGQAEDLMNDLSPDDITGHIANSACIYAGEVIMAPNEVVKNGEYFNVAFSDPTKNSHTPLR